MKIHLAVCGRISLTSTSVFVWTAPFVSMLSHDFIVFCVISVSKLFSFHKDINHIGIGFVVLTHLNLIKTIRTLFPNKVTFKGNKDSHLTYLVKTHFSTNNMNADFHLLLSQVRITRSSRVIYREGDRLVLTLGNRTNYVWVSSILDFQPLDIHSGNSLPMGRLSDEIS